MDESVVKYFATWLCGLVTAGLTWATKTLWRRQRATERGIQALLRDRIVQAYYHYSERGWITLHGLENVEAMYKEYHNLGGNGTVTKLVDDMRDLEVRDG